MTTVGCSHLEALITHRALPVDDDSFDTGWDAPRLEFSPELGIYPTSRPNPDTLRSAATSRTPTDSRLARYSEVDVLVEVRRAAPLSSKTPLPPSDEMCDCEFDLGEDADQLEEPVSRVFDCQHRLSVFMILFVEDKARLLRFARTGVSMTPAFDYTRRPEVLGTFLHRLSRSTSRTAAGHDPTATRANEADTELFRNLHTRTNYHAASAVGRGLRDAATGGWPVYRLCVEGRFSRDGSAAVLPDAPVSRREYLVGRPMSTWEPSAGRGTKMHIAYDPARDQVVVIKDSWRGNPESVRSEYDTYLQLYAAKHRLDGLFSIPTLLGGGDVTWEGAIQEARTSGSPDLVPVSTRVHCRLVFKEVCRHLEEFISSSELVKVTLYALNGAWKAANILHRDVSVDSILILDKNPEDPPDPQTSKGLLADWDLARTKDELKDLALTPNTRSGTWPFISARLQHSDIDQPHELADDLESFVHVLNYCALAHLPHDLSSQDHTLASFVSRVYHHVRPASDGGRETGSLEKLERLAKGTPFVYLLPQRQPLQHLLDALSELCSQHYHHIQFAPPPPLPRRPREGVSFEVLKDNVDELGVCFVDPEFESESVDAEPTERPPPRIDPPAPGPDPSKSPFKNHAAIYRQFLHVLRPPAPPSSSSSSSSSSSLHPSPAHGGPGHLWPVGDKIHRASPSHWQRGPGVQCHWQRLGPGGRQH
uniref:DNA helicase (EC) n=1 Tax=Ganoderma boninense TaxID=34458 RepID=A0A5K1K971_9APHY|nr:DNA helicase (EC [Ganoderma boninense]